MEDKKKAARISPWKGDFPILSETVKGYPLVYLDNAATTQMPETSIERLALYYRTGHANVHRGSHFLSDAATAQMETCRCRVRDFLHAGGTEEIVFTHGATDSIALVAQGIRDFLKPGMTILATELEHHSNFVPWQQICRQTGAQFRVVPIRENGDLDFSALERLLIENHVYLLAVTQVSNSTGSRVDGKEAVRLAHRYGAQVLVDGAQGIRHSVVDVQDLDCEYYCFSAHKVMGPTGLGILYGKEEKLDQLTPLRFGGGMVEAVSAEETTFADLPFRLEGGTPPIAEIAAFDETLRYLDFIGMKTIAGYEEDLTGYLQSRLQEQENLHLLGNPSKRCGMVSFYSERYHSFDLAAFLDQQGIAVRSGSLCAQPALRALGREHVVRVSPAFYNGRDDIDRLIDALEKTFSFFSKIR